MKIHLTVHLLSSALCWCATADEEAVKAREGATATLSPRETKHPAEARVAWTYGAVKPNVQIATVTDGRVRCNYNERFRGRLKLDPQTGALTIERLRLNDSAIYMFYSMGTHIFAQLFHLDVYTLVSSPSIRVTESRTNRTSVLVECSVENSRELSLSWFKGNNELTSTSRSLLSACLSLPLEIQPEERDDYSCVAENPVDRKVAKLPPEDTCVKVEEFDWSHTEAIVRLVLSAVFGLALIVVVVDHVRLRR